MRKTLLVIRQEVLNTLTRRSFLLTAFGVPLISTLIFIGLSAASRTAPQAVSEVGEVFAGPAPVQVEREGYVDQSGLIRSLPDSLAGGLLQAYPDQTQALTALQAGEIQAYYLIPEDYLASGKIIYVLPEYNPLSAFEGGTAIRRALAFNLLGGEAQLAERIEEPLALQVTVVRPGLQRDEDHPLTFFLPYGIALLYYIAILMSASFLLSSLGKEKENRVLEILLLSTTPRQLLAGKIIGLGLMGLLQNFLWAGTAYALLRLSGQAFSLPEAFQLPLEFLAWGTVFFSLGYVLYASLMAAIGALVPNLREASQATFLVILPMILPMMFVSVLVEQPNGALAIGLSLFPLTAPVAMMGRLAVSQVPLAQLLVSSGLLAATAVAIIRSVARLFRAQVLLSGQPFSFRKLLQVLALK